MGVAILLKDAYKPEGSGGVTICLKGVRRRRQRAIFVDKAGEIAYTAS